MKSTHLPELLEFLLSLDATDFRGPEVDLFFAKHAFDPDTFLPFVHFRDDTYGRNLVYRNDFFELLVLTWLPGHRTPIHDHASQRCWMRIDSGSLSFKNYEPISGNRNGLKPLGKVESRGEGSHLYIDDALGVHTITNASTKPAVSVHLYAGPIPECRIYNEAKKKFETKKLSYLTEGIWTPEMEFIESRLCNPLI